MKESDASSRSRRDLLERIVADYIDSLETDRAVDRQELLERHPELASELEQFFADYDRFRWLGAGGARGAVRLQPGTRLGDYEVLDEIGRGGMGVIFKARQVSLDRVVALKLILTGSLASEEDLARFRREAEAAARLQHRNIVAVHEVGEHDGIRYFSMQLIEGGSLADNRLGHSRDVRTTARLLETISRAVHFAHQRGIVHRDLKPANVLIDRDGEPHITDFGLAKRLSGDVSLTRSGALLGTPAYMAPEQIEGGADRDRPAVDVYSLGAILYELLTDRPPFQGTTSLDVLEQVRKREPIRPRSLRPSLSPDIETVCLKALEKDPRRRYASARALADELRRFLDGRPVLARPVSPPGRVWRICRRNPVVTGLAAGIMVSLLALTVLQVLANQSMRESLWRSYVEQARARRESGRLGQRFESLEALRKAAAIRPTSELCADAVASLALFDVEPAARVNAYPNGLFNPAWSSDRFPIVFDGEHRRIFAGQADGRVEIRRVDGGELLQTLPPSGFPVRRVLLSPDERYLSVRNGRGQLRVWDLEDDAHPVAEHPRLGWLQPWDFHPARRELAIGESDGSVVFYDLPSREVSRRHRPDPGIGRITNVRYRPHHEVIALSARRGRRDTLEIRDLEHGRVLKTYKGIGQVNNLAWSADGERLAVVSGRSIVIVHSGTGKRIEIPRAHTGAVSEIGFEPGGNFLATSGWDNDLRVWDLRFVREVLRIDNHHFLGFSADGLSLASIHLRGVAVSSRIPDHPRWRTLNLPYGSGWTQSVAFSPDSGWMAAATRLGTHILDARSGKELARLPTRMTYSVALDPEGENLLTWGAAGLHRWPIRRLPTKGEPGSTVCIGPPVDLDVKPQGVLGEAALSADGRTLAVVFDADAGGIVVLDWRAPLKRWSIAAGSRLVQVAVSRDGRLVASGRSGRIQIWRSDGDGAALEVLSSEGHGQWLGFTPDGKSLVEKSFYGYRHWSLQTWESWRSRTSEAVSGPPLGAFSPSRRLLALWGHDGTTVRLIEPNSGRELLDVETPMPVARVFFSPTERHLVVAWRETLAVLNLGDVAETLSAMGLDWNLPPLLPEPRNHDPVRHVEVDGSTLENRAVINAQLAGFRGAAIAFVTQNWNPGGVHPGTYNNHEIGVMYTSRRWAVFNQDFAIMPGSASFNVVVPGGDHSPFVHVATEENITGNWTVIDRELTNGHPDAIVLVTQNANPGRAARIRNEHAIGVRYYGRRWTIFNQDFADMPPGAAFNTVVVESGPSAFVHVATEENTVGNWTAIDHPLTNDRPGAQIQVTQNWNPDGRGDGLYNDHVIGVWYNGRRWGIFNQDHSSMPRGAAFNVWIPRPAGE